MKRSTFNARFGNNIRKAETGRGIALIDDWSYQGCVVTGQYECFPLCAWLESLSEEEIERYGTSTAMAQARERMMIRLNGSHFGAPIWGATGSYTVS